ncbi:MAG: TolC family protein, partial [Coxiellaceae bacterium]|nr:TolC family protein [Coxiellaceae bacterium]
RSAKLQRVIDKYSLEVARNEFEPQFSFNANGEIVEGRGAGANMTPGVKYKTKYGTQFDLGLVGNYYDGQGDSGAQIRVRQPLLRGFGADIVTANYCNAIDQEKINKLNLKEKMQATVTSVIQSYYQLVEDYNKLEVDEQALKDSLETLKSTQLKIEAGKVAPKEITQQEAQVSDQRFTLIRDNNKIDSDYQNFLLLLGVSPDSKFTIVREIPEHQIKVPNMQQSISTALNENVNFFTKTMGLRGQERAVAVAENEQKWRLDIVGKVNQSLVQDSTLSTISGTNFLNDHRVSLELEIPINDKPRKQKLINANINLKKFKIALDNEKKKLETEVVNAVRDLEAQQQQIKAAERSVLFAEDSLKTAQRKFEFGRTSMFEVTSLRRRLTQSKTTLIQQRITYLNTLAKFQQTLGVTLKQWHLRFYDDE